MDGTESGRLRPMRRLGLAGFLAVAACKAGTVTTVDAATSDAAVDAGTPRPDGFATDGFVMRPGQSPANEDAALVEMGAGTRLVEVITQSADGTVSVPRGWRDQMRNELCRWEPGAEPNDVTESLSAPVKVRCQPTERTTVPVPVFTDAGCTALAFTRPAPAGCTADPPPYVALPYASCPTAWAIYNRGARLGAVATYLRGSDGMCRPGPALAAGQELWAIGPQVPVDSFQAGVRHADVTARPASPDPTAPRDYVLPMVVDGADGSRAFDGWLSVNLVLGDGGPPGMTENYECVVGLASNGVAKCIPRISLDAATRFSDSTCTTPYDGVPRSSEGCPRTRYVQTASAGTCPLGVEVLALGARSAGPFYSRDGAAMCTADPPPDTLELHARPSGPLSASGLPDAQRTLLPGGGRLRGRAETPGHTGSTVTAVTTSFFDTQLGVPCASATASDGMLRCLPSVVKLGAVFSDAACTVADVVVEASPAGLNNLECQAAFAGRADLSADCTTRTHVFPISLNPYFGNLYGRDQQGNCIAVTATSGFTAYAIGPEIPATSFVEVKRL
jgi:hypothetical protein